VGHKAKWLAALLFLFASSAFAVEGTVTWSNKEYVGQGSKRTRVYTASLTSSSNDGDIVAATAQEMHGKILLFEAVPGAVTPTGDWDFTLVDDLSFDVLGSAGTNVTAVTGIQGYPLTASGGTALVHGREVHGALTLSASAMGNSKTGTVRIYVEE